MPTFTGTSGADQIVPTFVTPGVVAIGAPTPGPGADTIDAGGGNDVIDGGPGNDLIAGGAGDDYVWMDLGSGRDTVDGGLGFDTLVLQTGPDDDAIVVGANSAHAVTIAANGAPASLASNVESLVFFPWDGHDTITIGDLTGTAVTNVGITLQGFSSLSDQTLDVVTLTGSAQADIVAVQNDTTAPNGDALNIFMTAGAVTRTFHLDTLDTTDQVLLPLGGGDDIFAFQSLLSHGQFNVDGGAGNDALFGWTGSETLQGGSGNDTIQEYGGADSLGGGGGDDLITWRFETFDSTGPLTSVAGGAATDTFQVTSLDNGQGGWGVRLDPAANSHALLNMNQSIPVIGGSFAFEAANFDLTGVENVQLVGSNSDTGTAPPGLGASDLFLIGDLKGTGIKTVDIDLGHLTTSPSNADHAADSLLLTGSASAEAVVATQNANWDITFTGLPATVTVHHLADNDFLNLDAGAGNDSLDLSGITLGSAFAHEIHGGVGNDTIADTHQFPTFGFPRDVLFGEDGNDRLIGGYSTSVIFGGAGADTLSGAGVGRGTTFFFNDAEAGSDVITNFQTHSSGRFDTVEIVLGPDHSLADLVAHGHISQAGANVVITDGSHTIVTLQNIQLGALTSADFLF